MSASSIAFSRSSWTFFHELLIQVGYWLISLPKMMVSLVIGYESLVSNVIPVSASGATAVIGSLINAICLNLIPASRCCYRMIDINQCCYPIFGSYLCLCLCLTSFGLVQTQQLTLTQRFNISRVFDLFFVHLFWVISNPAVDTDSTIEYFKINPPRNWRLCCDHFP